MNNRNGETMLSVIRSKDDHDFPWRVIKLQPPPGGRSHPIDVRWCYFEDIESKLLRREKIAAFVRRDDARRFVRLHLALAALKNN
jgi:hypothetical protein